MDDDKTITRAHLTDIIYREIGLSHAESADLVDAVFDQVIAALERGESVKLSSFGTFSIRNKKQRIGRNPKTKQEVPISARRVVTFHASNILTKRINGGTDAPASKPSSTTGGVNSGGSTESNF